MKLEGKVPVTHEHEATTVVFSKMQ
jgi:hypothetical protein